MTTLALLPAGLTAFLAQAQPGGPGAGRGEEFGKTSPIALVVILVLLIATVLLIRSMNSRLRNVPATFDVPADGDDPGAPQDGADDEPDGRAGPHRPDGTPRTGSP